MSWLVSGHKMVQTCSAATTTVAHGHIFPCFDNSRGIIFQRHDVNQVTALQVFSQSLWWLMRLNPVSSFKTTLSTNCNDGDLTWGQRSRGRCLLAVSWLLVSAPAIFILPPTGWGVGFYRILIILFLAGETTGRRPRNQFNIIHTDWCSGSGMYLVSRRCVIFCWRERILAFFSFRTRTKREYSSASRSSLSPA